MNFDVVVAFLTIYLTGGITFVYTFTNELGDYDEVPYKFYLATNTPYRFLENKNDSEIKYRGCSPRRIWAVIRHGTRTPGAHLTNAIQTRLFVIREAIVQHHNDCTSFKMWHPHAELDSKKKLTIVGRKEMKQLGRRMKNRFPMILNNLWANDTFLFRTTDTSRTIDSLKNFATGIFGEEEAVRVQIPVPMKADPLLRFYKLCPKWRKEVKKNPKIINELEKFYDEEIFVRLVENVTNRFGLPQGFLNRRDLLVMYSVCAFETSWDEKNVSPWCSAFSNDEFKILEYAKDMKYYAFHGYGHEITTKIACPLFQDMVTRLRGDADESAVFYFTHSGTILKFLTHLGLYHDDVFLKNNNFHKHKNRRWMTSKIDAFGSNIFFIRFDCDKKKYILTMHQEKIITLPGCPTDSDLCSIDSIEKYYEESLKSCDFTSMCSLHSSYTSYAQELLWNAYNSLRKLYL